jgi:hypothetical protein
LYVRLRGRGRPRIKLRVLPLCPLTRPGKRVGWVEPFAKPIIFVEISDDKDAGYAFGPNWSYELLCSMGGKQSRGIRSVINSGEKAKPEGCSHDPHSPIIVPQLMSLGRTTMTKFFVTVLTIFVMSGAAFGGPLNFTPSAERVADWRSEGKRCDPKTWIPCKAWARKCGTNPALCDRPGQFQKVCPSCDIRS